MDYTKINSVLSDLRLWIMEDKYPIVTKEVSDDYGRVLNQGDTSEKVVVFDINDDEYLLKVTVSCDSYGDSDGITSIAFVKPVKKEVVVYE